MKILNALRKQKASLVKDTDELNAKLNAEGVSAEDEASISAKVDANLAEIEKLNAKIAREERVVEASRGETVLDIDSDDVTAGEDRRALDPKRGFKTFGEFAKAVHMAANPSRALDERLTIGASVPTTYGNEGTGQDGGFLVPPEFSKQIATLGLEQDSFVPLTDNTNIGGNSMVFPKDETTPWGTDGVRAYWESEAASATQVKPKFGEAALRLKKLFALVPVTDELLSDTNALASYLPQKTGESIRWKANDSIINGSGAGQPAGILNAAALVTVAKEGAQAAATLNINNVVKMFARMPAASIPRSVWLINNDVLPQLLTMTLGNYPIYTPPSGNISGAPMGLLLGRPVMISQHCKTLGAVGDVLFVDFKKYRTITKASGIETATSMHLYFDAGATAFRAVFRLDGQPSIAASITPANGSNNLSPFVTLAAR